MIYFTAHTFKCVCHCRRVMFRVLGMYNFAHWPTWSNDQPYFLRFGLSKTELTTLDAEYTKTYSTKPFSSRDLFPNFEISNYVEEPIIINIPFVCK